MRTALVFALLALPVAAFSQPVWTVLPNSPSNTYRFEDLKAVTYRTVFITSGSGGGEVWRTRDGGETWELRHTDPEQRYFRSLGFVSETHGWVGVLGSDAGEGALLETTDGGGTLTPVLTQISGPLPVAICGIYALDEEAVYATGGIVGGAYFLRTLDAGVTWTSTDLGTMADFFVDVNFRDRDHGFLTGGLGSNVVILGTDDGGETWTERFRSSGTDEWGWKLHFPTDQIGYVSVESNLATTGAIIKTIDGGQTWTRLDTPTGSMQGIGFVDPQTGWYGGRGTAQVTTDGGQTWTAIPSQLGDTVNRFAFFGDSLAYASAERIHRYATFPIANEPVLPSEPTLWIGDAYPNPFPERVLLPYRLPEPAEVTLEVFDTTGRRVALVEHGLRPAGPDEIIWAARDGQGRSLPSGTYVYRLTAGTASASGRIVRVRME